MRRAWWWVGGGLSDITTNDARLPHTIQHGMLCVMVYLCSFWGVLMGGSGGRAGWGSEEARAS